VFNEYIKFLGEMGEEMFESPPERFHRGVQPENIDSDEVITR